MWEMCSGGRLWSNGWACLPPSRYQEALHHCFTPLLHYHLLHRFYFILSLSFSCMYILIYPFLHPLSFHALVFNLSFSAFSDTNIHFHLLYTLFISATLLLE